MRARKFAMAAFGVLLLAGMACRTAQAQAPCDRTCLRDFVDQYVAAMVKHDPAGLALTADYKYTENTATMPLGDGLWVGASEGPTTFKIYVLDPTSHQAGLFAVMKEFDKPVILALRLKIDDRKI